MAARRLRLHSKVWLAWGARWAFQVYRAPYVSLGFHLDFRRPVLDVHVGWAILSLGSEAHITGQVDRHRQSCRGFLFADSPYL